MQTRRPCGRHIGLNAAKGTLDPGFGKEGASEILAEEGHARARGVNGVPTFFINDVPIASGAQKPELLASTLRGR